MNTRWKERTIIYIYILGCSTNKVNFVWGFRKWKYYIYICIFFNVINSDGSFHVPEDCQDNHYWPLRPELFLNQKTSVFSLHGLSFRFTYNVAKPYLVHWQISFDWKHASLHPSNIIQGISYGLYFSATKDMMTGLCSNLEHSVILNCLKTKIFAKLK